MRITDLSSVRLSVGAMLSIAESLDFLVEVYDECNGKTLWKGYAEEVPEEYLELDLWNYSIENNTLTANVELDYEEED